MASFLHSIRRQNSINFDPFTFTSFMDDPKVESLDQSYSPVQWSNKEETEWKILLHIVGKFYVSIYG